MSTLIAILQLIQFVAVGVVVWAAVHRRPVTGALAFLVVAGLMVVVAVMGGD